jgi:hypothetical protein
MHEQFESEQIQRDLQEIQEELKNSNNFVSYNHFIHIYVKDLKYIKKLGCYIYNDFHCKLLIIPILFQIFFFVIKFFINLYYKSVNIKNR